MPQFNPNLPWNDIPELPPAIDLESRDILKACISAMTELSRANALVKQLPSEEVLINTLPLQEARRSSEIENIVTTNDELFGLDRLTSIVYILMVETYSQKGLCFALAINYLQFTQRKICNER